MAGNALLPGAGAILGAVVGKIITDIASPDTPLGQLLNPPENRSRCVPLALILPVGATITNALYWADDVSRRPLIKNGAAGSFPNPDPMTWPWESVTPGQDVGFAMFDGKIATTPLSRNNQPMGSMVTAVFKNWAGGRDRRAGITVSFTLP